jgi:hypothetical protein
MDGRQHGIPNVGYAGAGRGCIFVYHCPEVEVEFVEDVRLVLHGWRALYAWVMIAVLVTRGGRVGIYLLVYVLFGDLCV